ncbi:hypothetical protein EW145_g2863 [Phellinidium pouzarii]|uniref:ATP12-domain-containing protein n=1 Tax=Phellinidium pouzarii TaxID=167371 RepID=A0A4S4L9G7_9AGAM|nr:hypothetical protein EW145_g2863 [Phellinidium pouzarii]
MACRASFTRWQASCSSHRRPASATNRAEATFKRFWKTVDIESRSDGLAVTLDRRTLKTPSGNPLVIPLEKRLAATVIATEWENQEKEKVLKAHALPMTSLASRVIDAAREETTRSEIRTNLLKYLDTDTICFHEDSPDALVRLQDAHWKPLLAWIQNEFNVEIRVHHQLLGVAQPSETKTRFKEVLESLDEWQLAAMERATYTTKSFLIALALIHRRIDVEQAAQAAHVEVNSQIERWGEVEDTHDVDYHDVRRQLGSAACLVS